MKKLFLLVVLMTLGAPALADTAVVKGRDIAEKMDQRDRGFGDYKVDVSMMLENRAGKTRQLLMDIKVLEQADPLEKSLIRFSSPRDIDGTAVLTYANRLREDDQWLFLPSVKRVKRISSANRSGAFVGSDFSYEDLVRQDVDKYIYRFIKQESCSGLTCLIVERKPKNPGSGYSRQLFWVDSVLYRPMRIEFFDRGGKALKTLDYLDYKVYTKEFWRPGKMIMQNLQSGNRTVLTWKNYRFSTGLTEADFAVAKLAR